MMFPSFVHDSSGGLIRERLCDEMIRERLCEMMSEEYVHFLNMFDDFVLLRVLLMSKRQMERTNLAEKANGKRKNFRVSITFQE